VENPALNWFTGLIRVASLVACLIVVMSFLIFATHQADGATGNQVASLGNNSLQIANAKDKPSSLRKTITDASNTLTSPFNGILNSQNPWPAHIIQLLIALALYGFGIGFAVRWVRMRS
jgi:hypothetical protein